MTMQADQGIVTIQSPFSVGDTIAKLEAALHTNGLKVFAVIDHGGEARRIGLKMPETKLLIFGSPSAGTQIMLAAPTAAIDLPLKILVADDGVGNVWVSHNSTGYLQARHAFPPELAARLSGVEALVQMITNADPEL